MLETEPDRIRFRRGESWGLPTRRHMKPFHKRGWESPDEDRGHGRSCLE